MDTKVVKPILLDTRQAARYLGLSPSYLQNARSQGTPDSPPFIKLSTSSKGRIRYRISDLEAWIVARRINPGEDR